MFSKETVLKETVKHMLYVSGEFHWVTLDVELSETEDKVLADR